MVPVSHSIHPPRPLAYANTLTDNVKKSSTYKFLNDGMKRTFTTGEKTTGDYATDVLQFNNIKVPNMQMGIMRKTDVSENIFGIGYV